MSLPASTMAQHVVANTVIEISMKGKWVTVPALEVRGKNIILEGHWLKTAYIDAEEWLETEVDDPDLCVKALKAHGVGGTHPDIFTFSQKLPATRPKYSYQLEWDSIAAIYVATFKEWWEKLPQETRKNVRRSHKHGVVVGVRELDDQLIRGIVGVNNDSPLRQGQRYTHYGKSYDQVRKDQSTFLDRSDFICAYLGEELIGFMKVIYRGDVASILQFLPKASRHNERPANALIAKAVELCETKGICYLTYGMFNYGNKRHAPLREFKVRNGFSEILVPRFYIPLTIRGTIGLRLRLHRGLIGLLPHSVLALLVNARLRLNAARMSRCSSMTERPNRNRRMECSNPPAGSNP